jgi:hypothetical protein
MKKLQPYCAVFVLTLVFATTTFAGDIHTPAPPPSVPDASWVTPGDIHTGSEETTSARSETFVDVTLILLQTMLSVL